MDRNAAQSSMASATSLSKKKKQLEGLRTGIAAIDSGLIEIQAKIDRLYSRKQSLQKEKEKLLVEAKHLEQACNQPDVNLRRSDFEWSDRLHQLRASKFGIQTFRPYQEEVINATMSGRDVILVMPTGGGKSLCFQLPALLSEGFTLVVSPLVSLMEDQTMSLQASDVPATLLSAAASRDHVKLVHGDMVRPTADLKLLYVTPEKIVKSKRFMAQLQKAYEKGRLSRIAIDEVHCCSQWGHDFRPDYKVLGILKRQFPRSPILGLTATASSSVLEDVKSILNIPGCDVFRASYNRANLYYEVRPKPVGKVFVNTLERMLKGEFASQSGIIYCFSRKDTETLAGELMDRGILAAAYHGQVEPKTRSQIHRNWKNGHIQEIPMGRNNVTHHGTLKCAGARELFGLCTYVVIATTAFGMGIDKPDVRFVVHHSLSKSMENYYQESGRAGRNDQPAKCILYFGFVDVFRQSTMVVMEQTGLTKLYQMVAYCISTARCRRSLLGEHFDDTTWDGGAECNRMCDACRNEVTAEDLDVTGITKKILQIIQESGSKDQRLTGLKLSDLLAKSQNLKGSKKLSKLDYGRIILHLLLEGYLKEDFHFTPYNTISYICAGPKAEHAHSGATVTVPMRSEKSCTNSRGKDNNTGGKTKPKAISKKDEVIILDDDSDGDNNDDGDVSGCAVNEKKIVKKNPEGQRKRMNVKSQSSRPRTESHEICGDSRNTDHSMHVPDSDIVIINSEESHGQSDAPKKVTRMAKKSKVTEKVHKKRMNAGEMDTGHSSKSKKPKSVRTADADDNKSIAPENADSVTTDGITKKRKPKTMNVRKEHHGSGRELVQETLKQKRKLEDSFPENMHSKRSKQHQRGCAGSAITGGSSHESSSDKISTGNSVITTAPSMNPVIRGLENENGDAKSDVEGAKNITKKSLSRRKKGTGVEEVGINEKREHSSLSESGSPMRRPSGQRTSSDKIGPKRGKVERSEKRRGEVSPCKMSDNDKSVDRMNRSNVSDTVDIASVYMEQLSSLERDNDSDDECSSDPEAPSDKPRTVDCNPPTSTHHRNAASIHSPASNSDKHRKPNPTKISRKHLSLDGCPNPSESSGDEKRLGNDGHDTPASFSGDNDSMPQDYSEMEELATVYSEQLSSLGD